MQTKSSPIDSMSDRRKFILFALMAIGQFMALLDTQIVAASISDIQAGLAAAPDESSWVQTAYLIGEIVMIPLSGWLSRAFSTRWLFTASAAAFTISSMACGFAWNINAMITARAIQGFVGGAMIPTVFATGFALFTGKKRAMVPAVLGLLSSLAPTIGPTLGGWITDVLSWHWLFFVNLVPGLVITFTIPFFEAIDEPDLSLLKKFDWIGLILLAISLGSLEYVLEEGYRWNWLDDTVIRNFTWLAVVTGGLFIWRSLAYSDPIIDLRILKSRTFAVACLFIFITGFGLFGGVYVLPLFLARVAGYDARQIGEAVFVAGLSQVLIAPLVARLSQVVDLRKMLFVGFTLFALGLYLNTGVTSQWQGGEFFWPQIIRGFALLMCIVPATTMALGALPPAQLKMASALFKYHAQSRRCHRHCVHQHVDQRAHESALVAPRRKHDHRQPARANLAGQRHRARQRFGLRSRADQPSLPRHPRRQSPRGSGHHGLRRCLLFNGGAIHKRADFHPATATPQAHHRRGEGSRALSGARV